MKAGSRPQYYRIRRMVQMVREGTETGYLPNSSDFIKEFEVSRRTVARDLDFLRDEERAPLAYDDVRHGLFFRQSQKYMKISPNPIYWYLFGWRSAPMRGHSLSTTACSAPTSSTWTD